MLKQEIEKVNGIETLPLNPEDISLAAMEREVPEHLQHFLPCLCGTSEHNLLKILSMAQSIIFVSSHAQKKMPKQVGLGVSLKANLRSREYINLLTLRWPRGEGGGCQQVFPVFLGNGKSFFAN